MVIQPVRITAVTAAMAASETSGTANRICSWSSTASPDAGAPASGPDLASFALDPVTIAAFPSPGRLMNRHPFVSLEC